MALSISEEGLDLGAVLLGVGLVEGEGHEEAAGAKLTAGQTVATRPPARARPAPGARDSPTARPRHHSSMMLCAHPVSRGQARVWLAAPLRR